MSDQPGTMAPWARNMMWSAGWIALALAFGLWIAVARGSAAAAEYYAAWLLEESLSIDNIFVFLIIFSELHIPAERQRRVLSAGVAGALVLRSLVIFAGIALIQRFGWIIYPFGALILFAAWRLLFGQQQQRRAVARACDVCATWIARIVPVSPVLSGNRFWRGGRGPVGGTPVVVALGVARRPDIPCPRGSGPPPLS